MYNQEQFELSAKAREALQRIKDRKNQKSSDELLEEARTKFDYGKYIFEEYSDDLFSKKVKFDSYIYNILVKEAKEEHLPTIQEHISDILGTVKLIYEHINIEPKSVGFKNLTLESSEEELNSEAKRLFLEYIDKHYYNLSVEERDKKYKALVNSKAYDLVVSENTDVEETVQHIYKAAVINNLFEALNFPFSVKCKIEELLESQMYREVFDAETLQTLWEDFNQKSFELARIVSLVF